MRTYHLKERLLQRFTVAFIFALITLTLGCSKTDDGPATDAVFSGTGSFNFTGDYNESFSGTVSNTSIIQSSGIEALPLSFIDAQGQELFIGLRRNKLESGPYTMKEFDAEGYSAFQFPNGLYDTGAIGGKGTVTITSINSKEIKGSVDMRLARPLNTADTVIVKGTFQLKSK